MTPSQQADVIALTVQGETTRSIEAITGIDHVTVNRAQHQLKPLINQEINELLTAGLTAARQTTVRLAKQGATTQDKDWAKIGLDASKVILNAAGITGTPSTVINQLINVNNNTESMPVMTMLKEFLASKTGIIHSHTDCLKTDTMSENRQPIDVQAEAQDTAINGNNEAVTRSESDNDVP
jgi:hypothetical protein